MLSLTLATNFTVPSAPSAPFLSARSSTALRIGWLRAATGGPRITHFEVQAMRAAEPPTTWSGRVSLSPFGFDFGTVLAPFSRDFTCFCLVFDRLEPVWSRSAAL